MSSFYGGPIGKGFSIAKIFNNKAQLIQDLENEKSEVHYNDYVIISYGLGGDSPTPEYVQNENQDDFNYNATLWQKFYSSIESKKEKGKIGEILRPSQGDLNKGYVLITSFSGIAGPQGPGVYIEEKYSTLEDLKKEVGTNPSIPQNEKYKKIYFIEENKNCYIWSEKVKDWVSLGTLEGPKGDIWVPSIKNNILTWIRKSSEEASSPPQDINIKGDQGETGLAAGFGVPRGYITTLPFGKDPTIEISALESSPNTDKIFSFSFGIPEGQQGPPGNQGLKGDIWRPILNSSGDLSWRIENTGDPPLPINIKGPQGDSLKIVNFLDYTTQGNLTFLEVENKLNQLLPLENNSLIGVSFKSNDEIVSYYYTYLHSKWEKILVSGESKINWIEF